MTLRITDTRIVLEVGGMAIGDATARADGRWDVSTWPVLLDRNQALTALKIAELLAHGHCAHHPLVVTLRAELPSTADQMAGQPAAMTP